MIGDTIFTNPKNDMSQSNLSKKKFDDRKSIINRFKNRRENINRTSYEEQWRKSMNEKKRLDILVRHSQTSLYSLQSVFPFDFFPDQISIEPSQINIVIRNFFYSENIQSIPLHNIVDCILETSLFFATIKIVDTTFGPNVFRVEYLKKNEAQKARRIIQGLIVATKANLDLSRMNPKELSEKVEKLGSA